MWTLRLHLKYRSALRDHTKSGHKGKIINSIHANKAGLPLAKCQIVSPTRQGLGIHTVQYSAIPTTQVTRVGRLLF